MKITLITLLSIVMLSMVACERPVDNRKPTYSNTNSNVNAVSNIHVNSNMAKENTNVNTKVVKK